MVENGYGDLVRLDNIEFFNTLYWWMKVLW